MTSKAEVLAPQTARDIVEATQSSWNAGSIDGMLQMYVDDLEYITNTGPDGSSLTIHGKEDFRARFEPVMAIMCTRTSIESFHFENGIARVRLSAYARHRGMGLELMGTYRQLIEFRDSNPQTRRFPRCRQDGGVLEARRDGDGRSVNSRLQPNAGRHAEEAQRPADIRDRSGAERCVDVGKQMNRSR